MTQKIPENYYFHGEIAKNFEFFQMPIFIITHPVYGKVSDSAKILYTLLFNRMRLSVANGWSDEKGRTYIVYSNESIMEEMNVGRHKAALIFKELVDIGLIEKVRMLNRPSRIYVFNFMQMIKKTEGVPEKTVAEQPSLEINIDEGPENTVKYEVLPSTPTGCDGQHPQGTTVDTNSVSPSTPTGCDNNNSNTIKNNNSHIYISHTYLSNDEQVGRCEHTQEDLERYRELIEDNICYEDLCYKYSDAERKSLDEFVSLMAEIVTFAHNPIKICGQIYPAEVVKSRFLKIGSADIESVIDWFYSPEARTGAFERIRNIRAYMIAMLFNCKNSRTTGFQNFFNATYYGDYSPRACI